MTRNYMLTSALRRFKRSANTAAINRSLVPVAGASTANSEAAGSSIPRRLEPKVTPPARAIRLQATTRSATRTLPLVSGLNSRETTTLAAAITVETSIGIAKPRL